jgi:hypothetical protein
VERDRKGGWRKTGRGGMEGGGKLEGRAVSIGTTDLNIYSLLLDRQREGKKGHRILISCWRHVDQADPDVGGGVGRLIHRHLQHSLSEITYRFPYPYVRFFVKSSVSLALFKTVSIFTVYM